MLPQPSPPHGAKRASRDPVCLRKLPLAGGKRVSYLRGPIVQFTLNQYTCRVELQMLGIDLLTVCG